MSGAPDADGAAPRGATEPPASPADAVSLRAVVPILPVADVAAAVDGYVRVLGFSLGWAWQTPPSVASVCRDGDPGDAPAGCAPTAELTQLGA